MKVAVFHPGTQHSWQTALALQQLDLLQWYATSIFYQPDRWPYKLERVLPGSLGARLGREFRRFSHPSLDPALVRTFGLTEWVERIAARAGWRELARRIDRFGNDRFVSGIARDLRSNEPFALWGFNSSSETSFALARQLGRTCILDRTNGDFRVYNAMMQEVAARYGEWFLPTERAEPESHIARDHREYLLADRILVGSPFAARTIAEATGDPAIAARTQVLNYCFDEALFANQPAPQPIPADGPVKFLFLGLVIPRKGIHHVLEAIARIPRSAAELTIVGSLKVPPAAFAPYADRITYIPTVARADVPRIMAEHHVFLLPSYFEGAGITLYEALASGNALIQSRNCAEAVTPETGIMLDRIDTESVYAAMMTAIEDRARVDGWRAHAQQEAQNYTFARYRDNIAALLRDLAP
ncbi:glycosyltransferase family 4 protein [Novosphingobium flavum]|uniref:Glycosyltransferase family 4 protein n=1 Tax=Novosphingobium flavum TaxID=1778672 RepID=A0A7X1FP84_9SPHN|nr:glycosyltransferase family 4 protein [Novosphingobium flavum]MBC2664446.1 glycosyltransferase family 4 protein [Novosphingobium flavum]